MQEQPTVNDTQRYAIYWYMEFDAEDHHHALAQTLTQLQRVCRGDQDAPKTFRIENKETGWGAWVDADGTTEESQWG